MRRLPVFLTLFATSCSGVPAKDDLPAAIDAEIAKGTGHVDLDHLADFEWDEVCFLGAFLRPSEISNVLGFSWPGKRSSGSGSVVFVAAEEPRSKSKANGVFRIPGSSTNRGSRWLFDVNGCLPRAQAKFAVKSSGAGPVTLVPLGRANNERVPPQIFSPTN